MKTDDMRVFTLSLKIYKITKEHQYYYGVCQHIVNVLFLINNCTINQLGHQQRHILGSDPLLSKFLVLLFGNLKLDTGNL